MANNVNQLIVSIYGQDGNDWGYTTGNLRSFPTQGISMIDLKNTVTMSGVTMKTIIKMGTSPDGEEYYTPTIISTLVANSN